MAKTCCICQSKIGSFDKEEYIFDDDHSLLICKDCSSGLKDAQRKDATSDMQIMYTNRAITRFAELLVSNPDMNPRVKDLLNSFESIDEKRAKQEERAAYEAENERRYREEKDSILVTTGFNFDGYKVTEYHGVVSCDAIVGTGIATDIASSLSDLAGTKSNMLADKIQEGKQHAYGKMLKKAVMLGGNAVLGVSYNVYVCIGNMLGASVAGTSVTIEKI